MHYRNRFASRAHARKRAADTAHVAMLGLCALMLAATVLATAYKIISPYMHFFAFTPFTS